MDAVRESVGRGARGGTLDARQVRRGRCGQDPAVQVAEPVAGEFLNGSRGESADRRDGEIDDVDGFGDLVAEDGPGPGGRQRGNETRRVGAVESCGL